MGLPVPPRSPRLEWPPIPNAREGGHGQVAGSRRPPHRLPSPSWPSSRADEAGAAREGAGGRPRSKSGDEGAGGSIAVAVLLAIAAVAAAAIGTRASLVSSDASDAWQSALRTEEKRSAAAMNDIRQVYEVELPLAVRAAQARLVSAELQAAASGASPDVQRALLVEAAVQDQLDQVIGTQSDLAGNSTYTLPSGGFDLARRLADVRGASPDLVSLDPDALEAEGDKLADKALLLTYALLPLGLCALLAVLAQPLRRYRLLLLGGGSAALVTGAVVALAVEVLA